MRITTIILLYLAATIATAQTFTANSDVTRDALQHFPVGQFTLADVESSLVEAQRDYGELAPETTRAMSPAIRQAVAGHFITLALRRCLYERFVAGWSTQLVDGTNVLFGADEWRSLGAALGKYAGVSRADRERCFLVTRRKLIFDYALLLNNGHESDFGKVLARSSQLIVRDFAHRLSLLGNEK